jgi:uncharacterized protein (DUF3820 family)
MSALTDSSPMPFGKHRGKRMEDVPASYLLWLWDDGHWQQPGPLHEYIKESFAALMKECPDFVVNHLPERG